MIFSDGSAKGGESLEDHDYVMCEGVVEFKHSESSKTLTIECSDPKVG